MNTESLDQQTNKEASKPTHLAIRARGRQINNIGRDCNRGKQTKEHEQIKNTIKMYNKRGKKKTATRAPKENARLRS